MEKSMAVGWTGESKMKLGKYEGQTGPVGSVKNFVFVLRRVGSYSCRRACFGKACMRLDHSYILITVLVVLCFLTPCL